MENEHERLDQELIAAPKRIAQLDHDIKTRGYEAKEKIISLKNKHFEMKQSKTSELAKVKEDLHQELQRQENESIMLKGELLK